MGSDVVTGRTCLGGIPMSVIAVETRTIEHVVSADPANPASFEQRMLARSGIPIQHIRPRKTSSISVGRGSLLSSLLTGVGFPGVNKTCMTKYSSRAPNCGWVVQL